MNEQLVTSRDLKDINSHLESKLNQTDYISYGRSVIHNFEKLFFCQKFKLQIIFKKLQKNAQDYTKLNAFVSPIEKPFRRGFIQVFRKLKNESIKEITKIKLENIKFLREKFEECQEERDILSQKVKEFVKDRSEFEAGSYIDQSRTAIVEQNLTRYHLFEEK